MAKKKKTKARKMKNMPKPPRSQRGEKAMGIAVRRSEVRRQGSSTRRTRRLARRMDNKTPRVRATELHLPVAGSQAPDFTLPDQFGAMRSLKEQRGKWVLVYFYPKDNTPGCTKEACMIRDGFPIFEKLGVTILGVSVDSVASHKKFADKYRLPFTLLSDANKRVVSAYGVWGKKRFMGREYHGTNRCSFLIAPDGTIAKVYPAVNPAIHADEVLRDLEVLKKVGG